MGHWLKIVLVSLLFLPRSLKVLLPSVASIYFKLIALTNLCSLCLMVHGVVGGLPCDNNGHNLLLFNQQTDVQGLLLQIFFLQHTFYVL